MTLAPYASAVSNPQLDEEIASGGRTPPSQHLHRTQVQV